LSLNSKQIEVFRAVMTTGSISAAAKLQSVSQPAISRLLSYTEQRLGFALFERIKGRLYPTPEAKELFREVEHAYAGIQRVSEMAAELAERRTGRLSLVCGPSLGHLLIPQAIARFREQHDDVKVTCRQITHQGLTDAVLTQRAELGVQVMSDNHPNLISTPVGHSRLVCICPYGHPLTERSMLTIADLLPYAMVSYPRDSPFGALVGQMYEEAGATLRVAVDIASPQHACSMVQAGVGIALVDEFSVKSRAPGELVVRPVENGKSVVANIVHSRYEPLSQLATAFSEVLKTMMIEQGFGFDSP
jgi:DNA-binding transcriptional LysR family regulator